MAPKNDLLYYRRTWALSTVKLETFVDSAGKNRAKTSLNIEKIADTTRQYLQGNRDFNDFKYDNLLKKAQEALSRDFERLGLNSPKNEREKKLFNKKKRIAISNWKERFIRDDFPTTLKVDFEEFIKATNIKSAQKSVNVALEMLDSAQTSNFYEIEHLELDLETGEIRTGISKVSALPRITLWLDSSMEGKGYTLKSFAEADIKNKKSLIRGLEFEFSPMYLYHVLGIGNDYVTSYKSKRDNLKYASSHKFDILFSSLYKIQHNKSAVTFKVSVLKDFVGVPQQTEYKYFKRDVLLKVLKDMKEEMNKVITMKENRVGRKVDSITFSLEYDVLDESEKFLYHYIASQLYYFSNVEIKSVLKFANFLQNKEIEDDEYFGEKQFFEWREEAEEAFVCEREILNSIENDTVFFKRNNLEYDMKKHTIMRSEIEYVDGEEISKQHYISVNGKHIQNPIASLKYIIDLENDFFSKSIHIIDFIPFAYATANGSWAKVDDVDKLSLLKEQIYKDVLLKNIDKFAFDDDAQRNMFIYYMEKDMFAETTKGLKEKIQLLYNIK